MLLPALAASAYGWAVVVSTFIKPGSIGLDYDGPGTDWMALYGAVRLAIEGRFTLLFDGGAFTDHLNTEFAAWLSIPMYYRPFVYPPSFLLFMLPFSGFGFLGSYLVSQLAGMAFMVGALRYKAERRWAAPLVGVAAVVCPAGSITFISGQLAFFVTGVLVLGVRLLPSRPVLGGIVLGLLSVKPQFAVLVPVILLARWQWASLWSAAASAILLAGLSAAVFGMPAWWLWGSRFLGNAGDYQSEWTSFGRLWGSSIYACAVLLGLPAAAASAVQVAGVVAAGVAAIAVRRSRLDSDQQLSALLACVLLAAPHSAMCDMVLLTVAAALWAVQRVDPGGVERLILLVAWGMALIGPPMVAPPGRLAPLVIAGFIGWTLLSRPAADMRPAPA